MLKKLTSFFLAILTLLLITFTVNGAAFGGLGIRPAYPDPQKPLSESWFIYNLLPGENKDDAVIVTNSSDEALTVKIYAVDGTTTKDGAFALLEEVQEKKDLGAWVTLEKNQITLAPQTEATIPFTIVIPSKAEVGDHLGGIILENLKGRPSQGVNVVTRVGVRIYQTVPGKLIKKLNLANFSLEKKDDQITFLFSLENEGNVHLTPKGKLTVKDQILGQTTTETDLNLGMIIPQKPTQVPIEWQSPFPLGRFKAKIDISYGPDPAQRIEKEISFWYVSQKAKIALGLIGLGLVLLLAKTIFLSNSKKKK